jgi:radical SAM superfamily enzyme YgiQ (UPF0313 family)
MRITLVYPPNRNVPSSPYGALPLLHGCLAEEGHAVSIVDANLEVFDRLLEPERLAAARASFESAYAALRAKPRLTRAELGQLQGYATLGLVPFDELVKAPYAARILRTWELFRDPAKVTWAYDTIANVIRAAYALNPVYHEHKNTFRDEFYGYLASEFANPISALVEEVVIDQILATKPDLVAVTIPFNEQTVEAFALLKALKRRAPGLKTMVGGAIISGFTEEICGDARMFQYADYAMAGEADKAFPRFATALENGGELLGLPNLIHLTPDGNGGGEIHMPASREMPNLNEIAAPDFSAVPVGRYLLPVTVVNYQTSRGCYYGKCTFCSFDIKQNFRFRKAQLVTQDIERIQAQTGSRHFIFWDPLTPPRLMKDISKWNGTRGDESIFWGAETKFEKTFTNQEFCDLLSQGGAKFLQFGFESGSQRVLDLMVKGNDLERVHLMLAAMENASIAVSVQWFIGFPGETPAEARQSYEYLDEHREAVLLSSYMGTYTIVPNDDVFESGGDLYDIEIHKQADGLYDFRYRDGSEHYDRSELNSAYLARGDSETVTRMAFYVYLTDQPERARELANFHRGGTLPETWAELEELNPALPRWNFLRELDFDLFTAPSKQLPAEGGPLPAAKSWVVFCTLTQFAHRLTAEEHALLARCDGSRTAAELAGGSPERRARLLQLVRQGALVAPRGVAVPAR